MWKMIVSQGLFQIFVLLGLMYLQENYFHHMDSPLFSDKKGYNTLIFNTFVLMQLFNEFNSRKINNGLIYFFYFHFTNKLNLIFFPIQF